MSLFYTDSGLVSPFSNFKIAFCVFLLLIAVLWILIENSQMRLRSGLQLPSMISRINIFRKHIFFSVVWKSDEKHVKRVVVSKDFLVCLCVNLINVCGEMDNKT